MRLVAVAPVQRRALYVVAFTTGLRRGELEALRWADVRLDVDPPHILARASTTKDRKDAWQSLQLGCDRGSEVDLAY